MTEEKKPITALATAPIAPLSILDKAIEKGSDIASIEKLVGLVKEMDAFNAKKAYDAAMAEFQKDPPIIKKRETAQIRTKTGGSYSYTFASLPDITREVLPKLGRVGLSVSYRMGPSSSDSVRVTCRITHELGHYEESGEVEMPVAKTDYGANPAQQRGISMSYAKRYALNAMLGLAPEEDIDGNVPEIKKSKIAHKREEVVEAEVHEVKPVIDLKNTAKVFASFGISIEVLEKTLGPSADWGEDEKKYLSDLRRELKAKPEKAKEFLNQFKEEEFE